MRRWTELLRPLVPVPVRVRVAAARRALRDLRSGARRRMATGSEHSRAEARGWPAYVSVTQPLGQSAHVESKKHNLALAIRELQDTRVGPEELFSFWHLVGQPTKRRGFVPGRNLVRGRLEVSIGGGLCQLSGLTYLLALRGGLWVTERHAHSVDIYTEQTRFAPLGADATVAYGYKDLRFHNTLPFPIALRFELGADTLTGSVCAPVPLEPCDVEFSIEEEPDGRRVTTWLRRPNATKPDCLGVSRYRKPEQAA
ncbi:VanW family protein [Archangium sp. Cb G35]|uniref:VanW family protein n=1 Tax=Archangium sp. Cb G35 TaxID=1920190 RepID=UPI0011612DD9|nr:VanW family protein [Archangium sp. Cb G35]